MKDLVLGIDIGTTAVKAAFFTEDGALQSVGEQEYPTHHVRPSWVEQNPDDWWSATCSAIKKGLMGLAHGAHRVAGLAVSAQAPTLIALDSAGRVLRPAMIWMDRRAEAQAAAMAEAFDVSKLTGNRADAFYVAPKLRWLRENEPDTLKEARWFVQITGYINYKLTGTFTLDTAHAGLLQLRTPDGMWIDALCDYCGVRPDHFPPISPSHALHGEITSGASEECGLLPGTLVMVGTVDGAAAALEAGVAEVGTAAEMTGTSTVLLIPNATNIREPAFIAMPHAIPGIDLLLGAMVATGANLKWLRDQFAPGDSFDNLTAAASEVAVGADGVLFLPYMMGERAPIWHANARGVLFGLSLATSKAAVVRAVLEGAAFALRHNVEVARAAGIDLHEIRSVGGGARSALWRQIKADMLNIPIAIPSTSVGAPFGDALLAGMGVGWYADIGQTTRDLVRIEHRYLPDETAYRRYSDLYPLYLDLYAHLRPDFDRAAALHRQGIP